MKLIVRQPCALNIESVVTFDIANDTKEQGGDIYMIRFMIAALHVSVSISLRLTQFEKSVLALRSST